MSDLIVSGLSTLVPDKDLLLVDVWGVLHNGVAAYREAGEALTRFREQGGTVILVSNAPRPGASVLGLLDEMGVLRSAYDAIVTSGDVARTLLQTRGDSAIFHLGPARDRPLFANLPIKEVPIHEAEIVMCTGLYDDEVETPDHYAEDLAGMLARKQPMVCANPDLVVERGARLIYCAGALADRFERAGGEVVWTGKPHRPIYEAALAEAARIRKAPVPLERVMAIGDALRTDIAGAKGLGVDALLVAAGIHAASVLAKDGRIDPARLTAWLEEETALIPTAAIHRLVW